MSAKNMKKDKITTTIFIFLIFTYLQVNGPTGR